MGQARIRRKRAQQKRKEWREKMTQDPQATQVINVTDKRAVILKRRLSERNQHVDNLKILEKTLADEREAKIRADGKIDGLVEAIAEEEGIDWSKVTNWIYEDTTKELKLTLSHVEENEASNGEKPKLSLVATDSETEKPEKEEVKNADRLDG